MKQLLTLSLVLAFAITATAQDSQDSLSDAPVEPTPDVATAEPMVEAPVLDEMPMMQATPIMHAPMMSSCGCNGVAPVVYNEIVPTATPSGTPIVTTAPAAVYPQPTNPAISVYTQPTPPVSSCCGTTAPVANVQPSVEVAIQPEYTFVPSANYTECNNCPQRRRVLGRILRRR